jgi:hypothetical protein
MQIEFDFGPRRRPIFLTPEEVADRFFRGKYKAPRGAVQHVYYLIRQGLLPAFKVPGKTRRGESMWRIIPTLRAA